MSSTELIEHLSAIVKLQADIIKVQAEALAQVGAVVMEEERAEVDRDIADLIGPDEVPNEVEREAERIRRKHDREAAALADAAAAQW